MKKKNIITIALILSLFLSACGRVPAARGSSDPENTRAGNGISGSSGPEGASTDGDLSGAPDQEGAPADGSLSGAPDQEEAPADGSPADNSDHVHRLCEGDNVVEHDPAGYCGNTVTTISYRPAGSEEGWEKSFWGSDSVALTDLLLYLDYSEGTCRCMPEYTVDTEFGSGYGINLTEKYARYNDGQVSLTAEQIRQIQDIIERISAE